ncbi:MAG: nickel pincer cofactor biosynthesis protein LarB [Thermoguttaceae bacterium]|nr:nickel pincer cofactor biosynthesis protein LarB [Thermoguttaceae bacterium]
MNFEEILAFARRVAVGELSPESFATSVSDAVSAAQSEFSRTTTADLGATQLDIARERRCGFPEVVYAAGKTVSQMQAIFMAQLARGIRCFATRMRSEDAAELLRVFPQGVYNAIAHTFRITPDTASESVEKGGRVAVITAGTSDLPVAEEAVETALWTGAEVRLIQDVGVAGPQRLHAKLPEIQNADAVVVVAGMEGALPSVVGGYVRVPIIAVPTSIGYGAALGGMSALLGMLNSCASNVTVVNIDAGFKGGYVAGLIAKNVAEARRAGLS